MDNKAFVDYLTKYFGNKVLNVLEETDSGISINSSKIVWIPQRITAGNTC